jgi:hypothetical protein
VQVRLRPQLPPHKLHSQPPTSSIYACKPAKGNVRGTVVALVVGGEEGLSLAEEKTSVKERG